MDPLADNYQNNPLEDRIAALERSVDFLMRSHYEVVDQQLKIIRYLDYLCDGSNQNLDELIQKISNMDPIEKDWCRLIN